MLGLLSQLSYLGLIFGSGWATLSCTLVCVRRRRGSTLTAGLLVDTVAVWNVAITGLTVTLTAVHGSLRRGPS